MKIKNFLLLTLLLLAGVNILVYSTPVFAGTAPHGSGKPYADLATDHWLHGSKSCKNDTNPAIEVKQADRSTYVLRQNKCITFEAPFIYVLFGRDTVLVVDTGANKSPEKSPIFETVQSLIAMQQGSSTTAVPKILVVHSHSHGDHTQGDSQFVGKPGVEVVGTKSQSVERQLGLIGWPNTQSSLDLGDRIVKFIPIPGHQEQSIAIYDSQTKWLLTGDSLYPGSIRVKNWDIYKSSIQRLFDFSLANSISLILGAHIEFNLRTNKSYRIGKTYQPDEAPLGLNVGHLKALNEKLMVTDRASEINFERFDIAPLSRFEKFLINTLSSN
jgi:glyoxylase-like metal-dependent hydrolase (beta-lactamase superfamily II)